MTREQYYSINRLSAICAWGMGEDVIIFDNWDKDVSIGMSRMQAEQLIRELQIAINECARIETQLAEDSKTWQN